MKLVTAVIHPETFEDVKAALENLPTGRPVFTECSTRIRPAGPSIGAWRTRSTSAP
jgi:nitrogen regulatory protein PII